MPDPSVPTPPQPDLRALAVAALDAAIDATGRQHGDPMPTGDELADAVLAAVLPAIAGAIGTLKDRYHQDLVLDTPADTAAYRAGRGAIEDAVMLVRRLAGTAPADSPSATETAQSGTAVPEPDWRREPAEKHVRAVQQWMALDLATVLGDTLAAFEQRIADAGWADTWAELIGRVRGLAAAPAQDAAPIPEPADHTYRSTACIHGLNEKCRKTCKWCGAPCVDAYHEGPDRGDPQAVGICGDQMRGLLGEGIHTCVLPAGHDGPHDDKGTWMENRASGSGTGDDPPPVPDEALVEQLAEGHWRVYWPHQSYPWPEENRPTADQIRRGARECLAAIKLAGLRLVPANTDPDDAEQAVRWMHEARHQAAERDRLVAERDEWKAKAHKAWDDGDREALERVVRLRENHRLADTIRRVRELHSPKPGWEREWKDPAEALAAGWPPCAGCATVATFTPIGKCRTLAALSDADTHPEQDGEQDPPLIMETGLVDADTHAIVARATGGRIRSRDLPGRFEEDEPITEQPEVPDA